MYPEHPQPIKNRFTLALAMQFVEVAADLVLFQFGERNIQFSRVVSETNQVFKICGQVLITDFEYKYFKRYSILYVSKHSCL